MRLLSALVLIGVVLVFVSEGLDVDKKGRNGGKRRKNRNRKNKNKAPKIRIQQTTAAPDLEKVDEESGVSEAERML